MTWVVPTVFVVFSCEDAPLTFALRVLLYFVCCLRPRRPRLQYTSKKQKKTCRLRVSAHQKTKPNTAQQEKPFSHRRRAVTKMERDVVRKMEKERERRALLSFVGWPVSLESFGVLVERGFSFFSLCHRVVFTVVREFSMR